MTTISKPHPRSSPPANGFIPPLENGDRMNAAEFRRRYEAMPHIKKAELLKGVVYMPSPVRIEQHGSPHALLLTLLGVYHMHTPGTIIGDNSSMVLDEDNEPQSDICLAIEQKFGGQSKVVDGYLVGAPEFVAEIAASSVSYDLHQKREVYTEFKVREYCVWRVLDRQFDWFELSGAEYAPVAPDADGVFRSKVFPGLHLAARSLTGGDSLTALAVLQRGLADPSHAAFLKP